MLTRRRLLVLAGGLPVVAASSCGTDTGSTLVRARRTGALTVGISGERPYGYTDTDGRITGAQPEVARVVLGRLGVAGLQAVQVPFDRLIPGLRDGQFDMITAGMTVNAGRCAEVAFTRPDFVAPPAFLVPAGNPRRIETFDDVARAGVRLAVLAGSAEQDYARAAGVPDDRLEIMRSQSTLLDSVAEGEVPVGALTALSLIDELRRNPGSQVEITDAVQPTVGGRTVVPGAAFAVRHGEPDLLAAFDAELTALHRSGEWLRITEPFGFTAENLTPPGLTTAELCAP
jgi:polar amino acid transport system substrate-binding protein